MSNCLHKLWVRKLKPYSVCLSKFKSTFVFPVFDAASIILFGATRDTRSFERSYQRYNNKVTDRLKICCVSWQISKVRWAHLHSVFWAEGSLRDTLSAQFSTSIQWCFTKQHKGLCTRKRCTVSNVVKNWRVPWYFVLWISSTCDWS